jgi:hypothetical protein
MLINALKRPRITVVARSMVDEAEFYAKCLKCGDGKGSTYRVTIPKEVVEVMGLEKGEMLFVVVKRIKPRKPRRGE